MEGDTFFFSKRGLEGDGKSLLKTQDIMGSQPESLATEELLVRDCKNPSVCLF